MIEDLEKVSITHPELGTFDLEVPIGTSDEDLKDYVSSSDFESSVNLFNSSDTLVGGEGVDTAVGTEGTDTLNQSPMSSVLKRNSKDKENVGILQDILGMDVGEDRGIFGPATEKAVKAFQKSQGLTVDGIVGTNTWAALQSDPQSTEPKESSLLSNSLDTSVKPTLETKSNDSIFKTIEDTAKSFWKDLTKPKPGMVGVNFIPSSHKVYANYIQGYTGIVTEKILNKKELSALGNIVVKKIKNGGNWLTYKDYGGKQTASYKTDISLTPELGDTLKFTLGKTDIIKHGQKILVADEYDLPFDKNHLAVFKYEENGKKKVGISPEKLRNASLAIKLEYISQSEGTQGKAHRYGELFGAKEGEGLSQRYVVGTLSSLGLTEKDVSNLMTLEEYEKMKISTKKMNPANALTSN
jgi:peptidoglycan hydrolase-like protein with peptidoglycan-binding domain